LYNHNFSYGVQLDEPQQPKAFNRNRLYARGNVGCADA